MRGAYSSLYYFYIFTIFSYTFISPSDKIMKKEKCANFMPSQLPFLYYIHSFIYLLIYLVVYLFIYQLLFFLFILGAGGMPGKGGGGGDSSIACGIL